MYLLLHLVSIQYYSWRIFNISLGSLLLLAPIFKYVFSAVLNFMYKFLCNVQEVIAQTRDKEAASMTEVSWRGRTVPVKNEKVRSFILHAQQSARELDRAETLDSKLTLYDDLLMECKDALQAIKDELKVDTVSSDFLLLKFLIPNTQVLDWYETAVALYTCVKLVEFKQCVSQSEKLFPLMSSFYFLSDKIVSAVVWFWKKIQINRQKFTRKTTVLTEPPYCVLIKSLTDSCCAYLKRIYPVPVAG